MNPASLRLVDDNGVPHELERLRRELTAAKRMLAVAHEELEAERDARKKYYQANERLKAQMVRHQEQVVVDEQVQRIFSLYRVIANKGRNYKLGPKRQEVIRKFLGWADYEDLDLSVRQAFQAIQYEKARRPDLAHNYDLEFVLRDEKNFERFRDSYLDHWAQYDVLLADMDMGRLNRFAKGTDPASVMETEAA